ncbi:uncharacterized protein EI97DRAFT_369283 [Westerdykella ornata]|uniref:Uncharacterized protein n=1 Tax=Westerdykella ornata TaxID=318751 RepID=A0A6A6JV45_WESOR|nr:uncharacterized protein EI97DRAFT_369283 [Westerdykella ornata]KAF2280490.1 hypothetical protein EI97DRAFT_369283 [Westerdykella ornata]
MLPDELLDQLRATFPCRELQLQQLAALYSQSLPFPPLLVAHGLPCTGKSALIKAFLEAASLPHVIVNCRECITGRHLLERTVGGCLDALDATGDGKMDRRPYSRTENLSSLVVNLQKMLEGRRDKFIVVFDGIDAQREAPPTLLPALTRFGEIISNLSVIMITTLPPSLLHKPGIPHLNFPAYTRQDLITILSASPPKIFFTTPSSEQFPDYTPDLAAEDDAWLWNRFLTAVWESISKHTGRDLVSFRNTSLRLWREFVAPIVDGTFGTRDFSRLMVNRRHLFQTEDAVLDRIIKKTANNTAVAKRKTIQHDLPYYTTHLLISAYLASYNPSRTDTTYFMKHSDKRKNKRKVCSHSGITKSKHRRIPRHLLTPSPFPLDRLLAIFRSLLDAPVPQLADIYTQIATLTSMRLLVRVGGMVGADPLDASARWRVNFGWEWVRSLGRSVGIEVGEYLVGGVDG